MNQLKQFILIFVLMIFFIRCTEIYEPDINSGIKALIVEGLITDQDGPYTIKLSLAKPISYDSIQANRFFVHDAKVSITENNKTIYTLTETSAGNYTTPLNFKAKVNNLYKLHITTKDGKRYESKQEILNSPQSMDSIRAFYTDENYLNIKNELLYISGADIRVDLYRHLTALDTLPLCRFASKLTIQYFYTYREISPSGQEIKTWRWDNFGWKSYNLNSLENIIDDETRTNEPFIKNHKIGFVPYDQSGYGMTFPNPTITYYLRIDQYTMNRDAYQFYKAANKQLSASGKIFDPIASQLYGNMKCINDPSNIVLGLFEVSSVTKNAYMIDMTIRKLKITMRPAVIMDVPKDKEYNYKVWEGLGDIPRDTLFNFVAFPDWWYHN